MAGACAAGCGAVVVVVVVARWPGRSPDGASGGAGREVVRDGVGRSAAAGGSAWCAPRGRNEECHEGQRHGQDHPPVGAAPSHSCGSPSVVSGPPPATGTPYACVTPPAPGGQAQRRRRPRSRRGVQGAAVPTGHGGELGDGVTEDMVGVEDLDLVGAHAGAVQVERSGPAPPGRSRSGWTAPRRRRDRGGRTAPPGPCRGTAGAAGGSGWPTGGRGRHRACPAGPRLDGEPRRREEFPEELLAVLPFPALAPRSLPATATRPGRRTWTSIRQTKGRRLPPGAGPGPGGPPPHARSAPRRAACARRAQRRGASGRPVAGPSTRRDNPWS